MARIRYVSETQTFVGAFKHPSGRVELKFDSVSLYLTKNEAEILVAELSNAAVDGE